MWPQVLFDFVDARGTSVPPAHYNLAMSHPRRVFTHQAHACATLQEADIVQGTQLAFFIELLSA